MTIDLLLVGLPDAAIPALPGWTEGRVLHAGSTLEHLVGALSRWRSDATADGLLCWDLRVGAPDPALARELLEGRGDVWHAGLTLGTGGQPGLIDFVMPNWMLNCDPPVDREATSWRVSLAACLLRTEVLRQMGLPCGDFETIEGAVLEWSHRCISRGVMMRHVPALAPRATRFRTASPSLSDEVRFLAYRAGRAWARWSIARASMTGYGSPVELVRSFRAVPSRRPYDEPAPYRDGRSLGTPDLSRARVTVLIPTLNRYKYLHVVLDQLRAQTVRPLEIIIVDQTAKDQRDLSIGTKFADLPLRLMYQDEPGQCASRNAGLQISTGDYILFIDDDDEVPPTLIERHLRNLFRFDADVSSGVAQEVGTAPLPPDESFVRASNVFPTNNTLARRDVLKRSGLFDLAFNRAPRADGDLGMRIYLSGAFMVIDQSIAVLHHHASEGGLRVHRARVITYRMSREMLTRRHLPHISEIYLTSRYFTPRQQREMLWLRTFGTLSGRGTAAQRLSKMIFGGLMLPDTVKQTWTRKHQAREWLERFPQIDALDNP